MLVNLSVSIVLMSSVIGTYLLCEMFVFYSEVY